MSSTISTSPSKFRDILSSAVPYGLERARKELHAAFFMGDVGFGMGVGGSGRDLGFEGGGRVLTAVIIFPSVEVGVSIPSRAVEALFVSVASGPKNGG